MTLMYWQKIDGWFLVSNPRSIFSWVDCAESNYDRDELESWYRAPKNWSSLELGGAMSGKLRKGKKMVSDLVAGRFADYMENEKHVSNTYFISPALTKEKAGSPRVNPNFVENWKFATRNTNPETLINTAKLMIGTPYLWGGTSIKRQWIAAVFY